MDRPSLQEQLDACRSAADAAGDLNLRALAEALSNDSQLSAQLESQLAADRAILERLDAVETPSDLKVRLAIAFRQGAERHDHNRSRMTEIAGRAIEATSEHDPPREEIEPIRRVLAPRRRYLGRLVGISTVVCVSLAIFFFLNRTRATKEVDLSEVRFAALAQALCTEDDEAWHPANSAIQPSLAWKPSELPFVPGVAPLNWKEVNTDFAGRCVIWDISTPQRTRAYVLMTNAPWRTGMLSSSVSRTPIHNSGRWSTGAWQRNGIAYALVVEGDVRAYGDLIQAKSIAQVFR